MEKTNDKKKQQLKNIGTATALTFTLVTSNVSTLAHANELEKEISVISSSINEEEVVVKEEEIVTQEEVVVQEQEVVTQEEVAVQEQEVITQEEVVVKEQEEVTQDEMNVQEQKVDSQEQDKKATVDNFNLSDWDYNEWSKHIILNKYNGSDRDIVIPGEVKGKQVKMGTLECFDNIKSKITSLRFEEVNGKKVQAPGIIKDSIFKDYKALESVDFSELDSSTITDMKDINSMFSGCSSLRSVDLSGLDTSTVTNMNSMFRYCSSLENVNLIGLDTSNVTNMRFMFEDCKSLTSVIFGDKFNTSKVTSIDNMFKNCSSLTTLDLSKFNTEKVTQMRSVFEGCSSLKNIKFGDDFKTSAVTTMNNMFKDCSSLTSVDLSNFDTSSVTSMSYMFSDSGVKNLDLSKFDTSLVEYMVGMFRNTENLESINFGEEFRTLKVKDMSYMFSNSAVKSLDLSNFNTESVTNMKAMFALLDNITVLDLSSFKLDNITNIEHMFANDVIIEANGNIIDNSPSAVAKELLVVTKDTKLIGYDYIADACLPVGPTLNANGGEFANGETVNSEFKTNVVKSLDEATIDKIISDTLLSAEPIRDGYTFILWEPNQTVTRNTTSVLDKLNVTYYAKWYAGDTVTTDNGTVIKPGPNSGTPVVDANGVVTVPEGGIVILPDGTQMTPEAGSTVSPDGTITPPKVETENPGEDTGSSGENDGSSGGDTGSSGGDDEKPGVDTEKPGVDTEKPGIDTEKPGVDAEKPGVDTENPEENVVAPEVNENQGSSNGTTSTVKPNQDNNSPQTGDAGVLSYIGLGVTSILGMFISNKKKNK